MKKVYGGIWVRRTLLCVLKVAITGCGKTIYAFTKKLLGSLRAEECLPRSAVCLWALVHALYKYPGTKMKGCHYVSISNVWCVSFWLFSVFPLRQYIFMHARKTLMCLLMAKAIGLMERAVPRAVSQAFRHISLSLKAPTSLCFHVSFLSVLCFFLLFSCISWCGSVRCSCFPWCLLCQSLDSLITLSLGMLSSWWGCCWSMCSSLHAASREVDCLSAGSFFFYLEKLVFCVLPRKEFTEDFAHEY